MKRFLLIAPFLLLFVPGAFAQTVALTGHEKIGNGNPLTAGTFMRFRLRNYSGNVPRVVGSGAVVQAQFDVTPDNTGLVSTNIYANDDISPTNTYWTVENWFNGVFQSSYNYGICRAVLLTFCTGTSATFNLDSATPIASSTPSAPVLPLPGPIGPTGPQGPIGTISAAPGPQPWSDITAKGARAGAGGAFITQTNNNSPNVTLGGGANQFQNGDGVVLPGVGAANAMSTPSAPTVTPSLAKGPTGTEQDVNSGTGASTYKYCYFAIDKNENVTACSPTTTINNGLSALGTQTATLTTYSRTNDTATYNTSASNNLVTNAYVDIIPNSPQFTGWYQVCSTPSNTQFTICGMPWDTRVGVNQVSDVGTTTVSGGTVAWVQTNKVVLTAVTGAWLYGVCAQRPADGGTYHLIGLTKPQGPGSLTDLQFDDAGATYHGNQTYPSWLSDSNCTGAASTNGLLSTTIVSGGGTSSIVLANNANATVTTGIMNLDACPGILAAAAAASGGAGNGINGVVYIPPITNVTRNFQINSYCAIPSTGLSIKLAGTLLLNQTLQLQGNTNIDGSFGDTLTPQFGNYAGSAISVNTVLPGVYATGQGNYLQMVNITGGSQNGDLLIVSDNANGLTLDGVNLVSAGGNGNDLLGMDMLNRDSSGTVVDLTVRNSLFSGGPTQTTDLSWTPFVWQQVGSFYNSWIHNNNNRRGVVLTNSSSEIKWYYSQGLINPQFTLFPASNTSARFESIFHDTDGQPTLTNLGGTGQALGNYYLKNVTFGSNPPNPIISGARPQAVLAEQTFSNSGLDALPNRGVCKNGVWTTPVYPWDTSGNYFAATEAMMLCSEPIGITSGSPIFWALAPPTAITATVGAGGSIPVSASGWIYSVSATGPDGGETVLQPVPSSACITSGGNQTCSVGYTGVTGASSYNVYRCDKSANACTQANLGGIVGIGNGWTRVVLHTNSNPFSDTLASTTSVPSLPSVTATGYPEITNVGIFTPAINGTTFIGPQTGVTQIAAAPAAVTQSATLGSTPIYAVPSTGAGRYRIDPYIETTTAGTAGTATLAFSYVNQSAVTVNLTCATINLAGLGSNLGTGICSSPLEIYSAASQNISYSVTNSGSTGTWTTRIKLEYLGQ